ncbi:MAG: chemotaxis protein CheW [candidate division Zixibacteria bacterium]|nr:chemotaxis protein CheW [candidate division Zixibacteria bacterium]
MAETSTKHEAVAGCETALENLAGKYLTFRLSQEEYGIQILKVHQIIGVCEITAVPNTPHYVRGIINLRGSIIPVIDLRLKFSMEPKENTDETCIIVVDAGAQGGSISMGVLVDAVSEVLEIVRSEIEETPNFGSAVNAEYILGIGKVKDTVKILLDIDKVLETCDISTIDMETSAGGNGETEEETQTA